MSSKTHELSPFEFKDKLIKLASSRHERLMLNAGRGNPNFLATKPRNAFLRLGDFALHEAERNYSYLSAGFGGMPERSNLLTRFDAYLLKHSESEGLKFISSMMAYASDHLAIDKNELLYELVDGFLGCHYPSPPRVLTHCESIIKTYLSHVLSNRLLPIRDFDIFLTEGGTAAMTYLFNSLASNGLVQPGDKIALITPIFSPYLEIPILPKYGLDIVDIKAKEEDSWQVPDSECEKLRDPAIKILFMVNPSNPPSVKMNNQFIDKIKNIIKQDRQDLMIITDDVYATFSDDFRSLAHECPYNTLCVYSFSKYFGATGWRLGTILLNKKNVFDEKLDTNDKNKSRLRDRYSSLTDSIEKLRFIDRLVADSRSVALNHTAGLSTPQQVQMTLFSITELLDENNLYQAEAKRLIQSRYHLLYSSMGLTVEPDKNRADYYAILDLNELAHKFGGKAFGEWFKNKVSCEQFITRLADETGVVLLPGKGFDIDCPAARVSLANLKASDYEAIGLAIRKLLETYMGSFDSEDV